MFTILKRSLTICLFSITALLSILSIFFQVLKYFFGYEELFGLIEFFNVDSEKNLPTFFAVFLLIIIAVLLYIIFKVRFTERNKYSFYWLILSVIFIFLAIDEACIIHERFIEPLRELLDLSGIFYYGWVILGLLVILIIFIFYIRFLISIPFRIRLGFVLAGAIYIAGALIMEMIGGWYYEIHNLDFTYQLLVTFEELLEMSGVIFFLEVLLKYLKLISSRYDNTLSIKII